jgi:hypothetical protein
MVHWLFNLRIRLQRPEPGKGKVCSLDLFEPLFEALETFRNVYADIQMNQCGNFTHVLLIFFQLARIPLHWKKPPEPSVFFYLKPPSTMSAQILWGQISTHDSLKLSLLCFLFVCSHTLEECKYSADRVDTLSKVYMVSVGDSFELYLIIMSLLF